MAGLWVLSAALTQACEQCAEQRRGEQEHRARQGHRPQFTFEAHIVETQGAGDGGGAVAGQVEHQRARIGQQRQWHVETAEAASDCALGERGAGLTECPGVGATGRAADVKMQQARRPALRAGLFEHEMQLVGAGEAAGRQRATGIAGQIAQAPRVVTPHGAGYSRRHGAGRGVEHAAIAFKAEGRERAGMHGGGYRCEAHSADEGGAQTPRMTDIHIQTPFDDCNAVLALCERL